MENASKALMIAGGVLLSVLIIGLVTMVFGNISELQGIKQNSEALEQAGEFNKKFAAYNRDNLNGSEVISAANQAIDYNQKYASANDPQYQEIKVTLKITRDNGKGDKYFKKGTFFPNQEAIVQAYNAMTSEIDTLLKVEYSDKKSIEYFVSARTKELQQLKEKIEAAHKIWKEPTESEKDRYNNLKSERASFKRKIFTCTKVTYDENSGRIIQIDFEEK